jgi:hypothetical protein
MNCLSVHVYLFPYSAMEEQRRILEAQIAEAQERKKMEKEKYKLEEILDEVRVKSQLGIIDEDKKLKSQLTRAAEVEKEKLTRSQQEVLRRKGLISNFSPEHHVNGINYYHIITKKCTSNTSNKHDTIFM